MGGQLSSLHRDPMSSASLSPLKLPHELREEFQRQPVFQRLALEEKKQ